MWFIAFLVIFLVVKIKFEVDWVPSFIISAIVGFALPFILLGAFDHIGTIVKLVLVVGIVGGIFAYFYTKSERDKALKAWLSEDFPLIDAFQFRTILTANSEKIPVLSEEVPFNRSKFFIADSSAYPDLDENFTIFYGAEPKDNEMAFQEYGFLVSTVEIIVKKQVSKSGADNEYEAKTTVLPYLNVYKVDRTGASMTVCYAENDNKTVEFEDEDSAIFIENVLNCAIQSGWTRNVDTVVLANNVTDDELQAINQNIDTQISGINKAENKVDSQVAAVNENNDLMLSDAIQSDLVDQNTQIDVIGIAADQAQTQSSMNDFSKMGEKSAYTNINQVLGNEVKLNQINDRFGGGQGHGHVGEQYGDLGDKLKGGKAERLGGTHEKNGADRVVNGTYIQTKYNATAGKSIGQAFGKDGPRYYTGEKGTPSQKMMQIEVPRDQYPDAVKAMQKRIQNGEVPNETNPNNAVNYVKRGAISYEHSKIATKSIFDRQSQIEVRDAQGKVVRDASGNIQTRTVTFREKLVWSAGGDFLTGARAAVPTAVVAGVWVYCNNRWQGKDQSEAMKKAMIATAKPVLAAGMMYMVASQFAGSNMGKAVGNQISRAAQSLGRTAMTNGAKTKFVTGASMATITAVVTVGPDLVDCLRGRISMQQLVKNTAVTGAGMAAGAATGAAVASVVPVVGTAIGAVVGGAAGSIMAKKVMDNFVEDDAVAMIKIAKEEFIETVMMSALSQEEFSDILQATFLDEKFNNMLKEMFAADNSRKFFHDKIFDLVVTKFKKRDLPDTDEILQAVEVENNVFKVMGQMA